MSGHNDEGKAVTEHAPEGHLIPRLAVILERHHSVNLLIADEGPIGCAIEVPNTCL